MDHERARRRDLRRLAAQQERDAERAEWAPRMCWSTLKDIRCACGHRAVINIPTRRDVRLRCRSCGEPMQIDGTIPG